VEGEVSTSSPIVRCRPQAAHWVLVGFLVLLSGPGLIWAISDRALDPGNRWIEGIMSSLLFIPSLVCAIWLARAQVVVDSRGLRWRGLGGWTAVAWSEVSDYYDRPISHDSVRMVVETPRAALSWVAQVRSPAVQSLRRLIEQRATSAAVSTWAILGTRPNEPRSLTFEYRPSDIRTMAFIHWTCGIGWMAMMISLTGPAAIRRLPETLGQMGWLLGVLGAVVLIGFSLSLPAMAYPALLALRETQRRRHQRLRAEARGLVFVDGSRRLEAAWDEVLDYFIASFPGITAASRYVVITRSGTFDFTPHLHDAAILRRMIAHYAKNTSGADWQPRTDEVLGGNSLRWTRSPHGDRERVYHYRTRTNRAVLCLPAAIILMRALIPALLRQASLEPPPNGDAVWFAGIIGVPTLYGWWRYLAASVRVSSRGIAQLTPFGRRFIPWADVLEYRQPGDGSTITVVGARGRIQFWTGIADIEELKEEIALRAINSRNKGWESRA
jgi:hypothetical protein